MKHQKRNYGYGRSLKYAVKQALLALFGSGNYGTLHSHSARLSKFIFFLKLNNTTNAVYITQSHFEEYANTLLNYVLMGKYSVAYAHNLISSVNVVMLAFRGDKKIWLSPKSIFGPRNHIRQIAPNMSVHAVKRACADVEGQGFCDIAIVIMLARLFGLRLKEAILIDAPKALKQAQKFGKIDIRKGTKGGRGKKVERWVPASNKGLIALKVATKVQKNKGSFIPNNEKLITFYRRVHRIALPALKKQNVCKIHDLRAAYVCQRYKQNSGQEAPVISGKTEETSEQLTKAKQKISKEIGHSRECVIHSYSGK